MKSHLLNAPNGFKHDSIFVVAPVVPVFFLALFFSNKHEQTWATYRPEWAGQRLDHILCCSADLMLLFSDFVFQQWVCMNGKWIHREWFITYADSFGLSENSIH